LYLPRSIDRRLPHLRLEDNEDVPHGTAGEEDEAREGGRESNLAGSRRAP
jgi:hypothetical protein